MSFCLDANVFIQAYRVRYPMDFAPGFWDQMAVAADRQIVFSLEEVFDELKDFGDGLSDWVRTNREVMFRKNDDDPTQRAMVRVGFEIETRLPAYTEAAKLEFLEGADPWLIAYCLAHGHTLVTEEVGNPRQINKVRIPDICAAVGVTTIPMLQLLRSIKFRLVAG